LKKLRIKNKIDKIKDELSKKAQKLGEIIYADMPTAATGAERGFDPNAQGFNPEDFCASRNSRKKKPTVLLMQNMKL